MSEHLEKVCSICTKSLPATTEYFGADKTRRDGLHPQCKACRKAKRCQTAGKLIAPNREQFADDTAFEKALEWHRLELDKAAAELVLNNPDAKFTKREAARKSLEQTLERMQKLKPAIQTVVKGGSTHPAPSIEQEKVFQSQHKPGSEEYVLEMRGLQRKIVSLSDYLNREDQWKGEDPASYAAELIRREEEDAERRRRNAAECSGGLNIEPTTVIGQRLTTKPKTSAVVKTETVPTYMPPPKHDVIFVLEDGFHFYPDLTEAIPPLPMDVTFARAPLPPGYTLGDRKIDPHYRYDRANTCWWRV